LYIKVEVRDTLQLMYWASDSVLSLRNLNRDHRRIHWRDHWRDLWRDYFKWVQELNLLEIELMDNSCNLEHFHSMISGYRHLGLQVMLTPNLLLEVRYMNRCVTVGNRG